MSDTVNKALKEIVIGQFLGLVTGHTAVGWAMLHNGHYHEYEHNECYHEYEYSF